MASEITNEEIEALAKGIGINNKIDGLGLQLGYEYSAIDIYKASNHSGAIVSNQGTRQMLKDWREKTPQERQRPVLKKALEDADLVWLGEKHLGGALKRRVNTSPGPAQKRQKVTESGATSKAKSPGKLPNVTTKKVTTKTAAEKKARAKTAAEKKARAKKAAEKKARAKKAADKKATTNKAADKKATTKKATQNEATTKKATTKKATEMKATKKKTKVTKKKPCKTSEGKRPKK